ncbi:recombinase family protein [Pantoea sp. EA-12]|uniref:recombinase family protein n=1 Tax=Pantoea sp. EA-12 TaxID=3043303 RepID=UPI0024B4A9BE|nr:recombinase family protein [Pantoea sp. EA-12]MDI9222119.1 recombinase family protein [Pantoea sp. EA-12]
MSSIDGKPEAIRVAQYLRMSTEHQQYSIENQERFIHEYAERHGMIITHTYDDAGKSGVTLSGRNGLKQLLKDVMNHIVNINAVLVYDVSRFGRFPDPEEAAHYSYLLKEHGVRIIYCADPLPDEYPEMSMLALPVLRYGAASYSKNLSQKVFIGQVNLVRRGFHQGGTCGYGLQRLLIDERSESKGVLKRGQRKSLQTDRVILIPGPEDEVKVVNQIYDYFIYDGYSEGEIASLLNLKGIIAENNSEWSRGKVRQILTNEKYVGNNVYNRVSFKLKVRHVRNPPEEWVRCDNAFDPVVSTEKFTLANEIIKRRMKYYEDEELIDYLKKLYLDEGGVTSKILKENSGPNANVFTRRFGSLIKAYRLAEIPLKTDYSYIEINKHLKDVCRTSNEALANDLASMHCTVINTPSEIKVCNETSICFLMSKYKETKAGSMRWQVKAGKATEFDLTVIVRMEKENKCPEDYFVIPTIDKFSLDIKLKLNNPRHIQLYRFSSLDRLIELFKRTTVTEAQI